MKYKIEITRIDTREVTKQGAWTVVAKRPWSNETLAGKTLFQGNQQYLKDNPLEEVYGYTPSYQSTETESVKVFEQTAEDLDIKAVIKAINSI